QLARARGGRLAAQGAEGESRVLPAPHQDGANALGPRRAHRAGGCRRRGMKRVGIVAKTDREEARTTVAQLLGWCAERGLAPFLDKETAALRPEPRRAH